ncbi:unnamed protein product [Oreochromis niloticus]|nr:unnamed protein product [Mustela putorius furo]
MEVFQLDWSCLVTHDCRPADGSNTIIKFADDTTVIGLISDNDEAAYREEVDRLAEWCDTNNLLLNTEKTKELIVDYRRNADPHPPIHIKGTAVERVNSFKFLGVHISEDLTWTTNCSKLVKKAHQRLFFLRTLRKNHLSSDILVNFYRCTIESILTNCITVWYGNCSASDRKALQRVVKTAQRIAGAPLPAIKDIYRKRCLKRAGKIIRDPSHPSHGLFTLLPSGRRYRSLRTKTTRPLIERNGGKERKRRSAILDGTLSNVKALWSRKHTPHTLDDFKPELLQRYINPLNAGDDPVDEDDTEGAVSEDPEGRFCGEKARGRYPWLSGVSQGKGGGSLQRAGWWRGYYQ